MRLFRLLLLLLFTVGFVGQSNAATLRIGQRVLARWRIQKNHLYSYPATISGISGLQVTLNYDDGSVGPLPMAGVVARSIRKGDFLASPQGPAVVVQTLGGGAVLARLLGGQHTFQLASRQVRTLLRTDQSLGVRPPTVALKAGDRVLAKWDFRSWWVGRIKSRVGEALWIQYDDGSLKWIPADFALPLSSLKPGAKVYGINRMEGQIIPARLVSLSPTAAKIRFFDQRLATVPLAKLVVPVDQVGLDFGDSCKLKPPTPDPRPGVAILRSWLTSKLHFYTRRNSYNTSATHLELGFCLYLPGDRQAKPGWKAITTAMARQVKYFLTRELGNWTRITIRVHPVPAQSPHSLAWLKQNLREAHAWHVWDPTRVCVNAMFPDGAKAGRHRAIIVLPDAPGISKDSSGVERGIGFVRMKGDWFQRITVGGVIASTFPQNTSFSQWIPNYLSTTIAHEVLHTIGLPHTDGDPFEVMNIGPWYPINRKEVHVAEIHKLILRSPFEDSLSLSQGFAAYLLDYRASYLKTVRATRHADTRLRLRYAMGRGFFRLNPLFSCFAPRSRGRIGQRKFTGERILCRAYLASFVHFLVERNGTKVLLPLKIATDYSAVPQIAAGLRITIPALEKAWHRWLVAKKAGW